MTNLTTTFTKSNYRQPKDAEAFLAKRSEVKRSSNEGLFKYNDGGRAAAGLTDLRAGDCVTRAIAISTELPYTQVYEYFAQINKMEGRRNSADSGVSERHYGKLLQSQGYVKMHGESLNAELLSKYPNCVVGISHHLLAVVDGVVNDTYDSINSGRRRAHAIWVKQNEVQQQPALEISEAVIQPAKSRFNKDAVIEIVTRMYNENKDSEDVKGWKFKDTVQCEILKHYVQGKALRRFFCRDFKNVMYALIAA